MLRHNFNSSDAETGIFWNHKVITMAVDAMDPYVARSSATKVLTIEDKRSLSLVQKDFKYLYHLSIEKWKKMQIYLYVSWKHNGLIMPNFLNKVNTY